MEFEGLKILHCLINNIIVDFAQTRSAVFTVPQNNFMLVFLNYKKNVISFYYLNNAWS